MTMAIELGAVQITLLVVIVGAKLDWVVGRCWRTSLPVLHGEGDGVTEGGLVIAIKVDTVARHGRAVSVYFLAWGAGMCSGRAFG